jgi:hypothetical protein
VKNVLDICITYNLQNFVLDAIEKGEYCSILQWKKMVKSVISDRHVKSWNATQPLYKSLKYMKVLCNTMSPWWVLAHKCPLKAKQVRLIIQLLLDKDRHKHNFNGCCNECVIPSTHHILFECSSVRCERRELWDKVMGVCPPRLQAEFNMMSSDRKCEFVLNGFNCGFIPEWQTIYENICEFINVVYKKYEKM